MLARNLLGVGLLLAASAAAAQAEDPVVPSADVLSEGVAEARFAGATEVVASRLGRGAVEVGRRLVVVTREEIADLPVASVQELLAALPGVGLARRGARGVQADLDLRGGTVEQAVVLVNGVRVNNPQTGHHTLDLFIPLAAVERVEVLYGPGSAVHGPDAFGGAVNIVTRVVSASAYARAGSNDLAAGGVAGALGRGLWAALEREVHTGFRDDTEMSVNQIAGGWQWSDGSTRASVSLSAGQRSFGAYRFYSTVFPWQRERTSGELLTAHLQTALGGLTLGANLRLDRHRDHFVLDRTRPDFYVNDHTTRGALLNLNLIGDLAGFTWAAGVEAARDEIDSTNLGRRHRVRTAVFLEAGRQVGSFSGGLQLRLDRQTPWGEVGTVALGGAWTLPGGQRLRLHHGQSFRAPSFTELHYTSPSRVGNPDLAPERGRTTEVGVDGGGWSVTLFERRAHPLVDFVLGDDGVWRAENLGRVTTRGAEAALLLPVWGRLRWQRLGAVWLDTTAELDPARSAYALAHPRLEATWTGSWDLGGRFHAGWTVRWRDPVDGGSWATLDLRLRRRILNHMSISVEATNLLDREVTELHGVPLPGRWLSVTVGWQEESP